MRTDNITLVEDFLEMLSAERCVADNTLIAYKGDILDFFVFLSETSRSLEQCDYNILVSYVTKLGDRSYSPKSIRRKISALRQFFEFLVMTKKLTKSPAAYLERPKSGLSLPKALSKEEIAKLIQLSYQDQTALGVRFTTMLELLYATGLRISELVTLKLSAIERNAITGGIQNHIFVSGKGGKERLVLLNESAIAILGKYLEVRKLFMKEGRSTQWLFPSMKKNGLVSHLTRQRFTQFIKKLAVFAGFERNKISSHKIRHSFASHMLENGANLRVIQELLGHSDISSTQIYTKVLKKDAEKLLIKKHPLSKLKMV
ncbi:tyrosine recombinase [Rickettsiales endosymbiont of Peranema trichophorum]|uniref:tyrosine recombinase n=1 Tax=Rickettsiales endosymbiont of Peranema trichophorum TaxID=2486577 RepID=UPI0010237E95|nr:tyrosine recombinase [Rickettsiales endosymbiont of Peranema trichophorum]RZI47471.1 tyrosine recombinase [Rickettsiales endosymbiont of Peranema trichophorum]